MAELHLLLHGSALAALPRHRGPENGGNVRRLALLGVAIHDLIPGLLDLGDRRELRPDHAHGRHEAPAGQEDRGAHDHALAQEVRVPRHGRAEEEQGDEGDDDEEIDDDTHRSCPFVDKGVQGERFNR